MWMDGWIGLVGGGWSWGWYKVVLRIDLQKSKSRSRLCLWERAGTATKYETIFILKFYKHSMLNLICKKNLVVVSIDLICSQKVCFRTMEYIRLI